MYGYKCSRAQLRDIGAAHDSGYVLSEWGENIVAASPFIIIYFAIFKSIKASCCD